MTDAVLIDVVQPVPIAESIVHPLPPSPSSNSQLVIGWESTRQRPRGTFRSTLTTFSAEVGYAFGREFGFDSNAANISVDDALLLRTTVEF